MSVSLIACMSLVNLDRVIMTTFYMDTTPGVPRVFWMVVVEG